MGEGQKITQVLMSIILLSQVCWTEVFYYTSTHEELCYNNCSMTDNGYYWCNTKKGGDYCSPIGNTDYKGNECKDDHPCEKHGEDHYWCYTKAGTRGYCGKVELRTLLYISSTYRSVCRNGCPYDESNLYYWCYTDRGWDYCSPAPRVTLRNKLCRSDHPCDTHGYSYTWCRTDSGWNYCGLFENRLCSISMYTDKGNNKVAKIIFKSDPTVITDGSTWENEITNLISRWNNSYLGNQARSQLITLDNLHIDLQELVKWKNRRYYHLQIQVNVPQGNGMSTTVAQVFIPQNKDIPDSFVRMAFTESFRSHARVFEELNCGTT